MKQMVSSYILLALIKIYRDFYYKYNEYVIVNVYILTIYKLYYNICGWKLFFQVCIIINILY